MRIKAIAVIAAISAAFSAPYVVHVRSTDAQTTDPSVIRVDYYEGKVLLGTRYEAHVPEAGDRVSLVVQSGDAHTSVTRTVATRRFVFGTRIVVSVTP